MFDATLVQRRDVADATTAFYFTRPRGFEFAAGQAIDVVLGATPGAGAEDERHAFSIASAPCDDEIVIATRMRGSRFKQALGRLPVGGRIALDGPFGDLVPDPARAAILVAGGIGITPFRSMLRQAAHDGFSQRVALLYSNRRPEDAAFLEELGVLAERDACFRLVATMTRMRESKRAWPGHTGAIDEKALALAARDLIAPLYYVAGPPAMVEGVCQTLALAGVDESDIRSEAFYGY